PFAADEGVVPGGAVDGDPGHARRAAAAASAGGRAADETPAPGLGHHVAVAVAVVLPAVEPCPPGVGGGARLALVQVVDVAGVELAEAVAGVGDVQPVAVPGDAPGVDVDVGVGGLVALHRRVDEEDV